MRKGTDLHRWSGKPPLMRNTEQRCGGNRGAGVSHAAGRVSWAARAARAEALKQVRAQLI